MWFKITLAQDGAIRGCEEVSASFISGERVLCVEADTRAKAIEVARKQWKAAYRKRVYNERKGLGVCVSCNQPALEGFVTCAAHRAHKTKREAVQATYRKRKALGLAPGEPMPVEHDGRATAVRRPEQRAYGRQPNGFLNLRTLLVCQANWREMSAMKFGQWLEEQIAEYRVAKVSPQRRAS